MARDAVRRDATSGGYAGALGQQTWGLEGRAQANLRADGRGAGVGSGG